jgi:hypothetical protein
VSPTNKKVAKEGKQKTVAEDFKEKVEKAALKKHANTMKEKDFKTIDESSHVEKLKDEKIISINKEGVAAVEVKTAGR